MSLNRPQPNMRQLLLMLAAILLVSYSLSACNLIPQATILQTATVEPSPTARPSFPAPSLPEPTRTRTGPEKEATKNARFDERRRLVDANSTKFALGTPYPTTRPYVAPTPEPVPTLATRIHGECADGNSEFLYTGCWTGRLGNEYLFVEAGAPLSNLSQGMIRIYSGTLDLSDFGLRQSYSTPSGAGIIRITNVTWPHMTLVTRDADPPVTFGFDLTTRQWISPPPLPTPSLSVPPLPTLSPGLSPIPSAPPLP